MLAGQRMRWCSACTQTCAEMCLLLQPVTHPAHRVFRLLLLLTVVVILFQHAVGLASQHQPNGDTAFLSNVVRGAKL
jgi:hypothetical protein